MGTLLEQNDIFFKEEVLQLCQPNVRLTGLLKEVPHNLRAATSRANKGGRYGYTPE